LAVSTSAAVIMIRNKYMKITTVDVMELKPRKDKYFRPIVCRNNTDEGLYGYGEAALAYEVSASGSDQDNCLI